MFISFCNHYKIKSHPTVSPNETQHEKEK